MGIDYTFISHTTHLKLSDDFKSKWGLQVLEVPYHRNDDYHCIASTGIRGMRGLDMVFEDLRLLLKDKYGDNNDWDGLDITLMGDNNNCCHQIVCITPNKVYMDAARNTESIDYD